MGPADRHRALGPHLRQPPSSTVPGPTVPLCLEPRRQPRRPLQPSRRTARRPLPVGTGARGRAVPAPGTGVLQGKRETGSARSPQSPRVEEVAAAPCSPPSPGRGVPCVGANRAAEADAPRVPASALLGGGLKHGPPLGDVAQPGAFSPPGFWPLPRAAAGPAGSEGPRCAHATLPMVTVCPAAFPRPRVHGKPARPSDPARASMVATAGGGLSADPQDKGSSQERGQVGGLGPKGWRAATVTGQC